MKLYLIPIPLDEETIEQVLPILIQEVVAEVDTFFVENIRTARRFISSLKLGKVIDDLTFYELSKDTPEAETLKQLKAAVIHKKNIGVMSEAGCPGIADPGAVAVKIAHQLGIEVVPLVGPSSMFDYPAGLVIDKAGNMIIADEMNHLIRKISTAGIVTTLAGSTEGSTDGDISSAKFARPTSVVIDASGNIIIADSHSHRIRKIEVE